MSSKTREGVELKYIYAYGEIAKLLADGKIKYTIDSLGFVFVTKFPTSDRKAIEDVLKSMD